MAFNYYYGSQAEQFSFVRIPRIMLTDKAFQTLSITSKVLYGVLLDRMSLSMKNNWFDEENRVYIIYQIGEIMEDLGLTKKKAMDLLQELEAFGLLEKKRRGHGLPNILYVKNFMPESGSRGDQTGTSESESEPDHSEGQTEKEPAGTGSGNDRIRLVNLAESQTHSRGSENGTSDRSGQHSRSDGFGIQEVPKTAPLEVQDSAPLRNQTDNNYTYRNQTESNLILSADSLRRYDEMRFDAAPDDVVSAYQQLIRENVDYDSLVIAHPYDRELIDGIVDLIS